MDDDDDEVSSSHTVQKIQQSAAAASEQTVFNSKHLSKVICDKNEVSNKNDQTTIQDEPKLASAASMTDVI